MVQKTQEDPQEQMNPSERRGKKGVKKERIHSQASVALAQYQKAWRKFLGSPQHGQVGLIAPR